MFVESSIEETAAILNDAAAKKLTNRGTASRCGCTGFEILEGSCNHDNLHLGECVPVPPPSELNKVIVARHLADWKTAKRFCGIACGRQSNPTGFGRPRHYKAFSAISIEDIYELFKNNPFENVENLGNKVILDFLSLRLGFDSTGFEFGHVEVRKGSDAVGGRLLISVGSTIIGLISPSGIQLAQQKR